jgi:hypothetical protein
MVLGLERLSIYIYQIDCVISKKRKLTLYMFHYLGYTWNLMIDNLIVRLGGRINHRPWHLYITCSKPSAHSRSAAKVLNDSAFGSCYSNFHIPPILGRGDIEGF